jgi:cytochrome b561
MSRIDPVRAVAARYDAATIALHWTTAVLVATLWIIGQTIDFWPRGPLRVDYRSVHILLGALLACVILARLGWRASRGARVPAEGPRLAVLAAKAVHWALYALVGTTIALGLLTAFAQGDSLFGLLSLPSFAADNRALARTLFGWHSLAANGVLILAGLHAAAALMHHHLMRDNTLRRMLPRRFAG